MEDKKQHRRFFTDEEYQKDIKKSSVSRIEREIAWVGEADQYFEKGGMKDENYHPPIDMADISANAIITELQGRSGVDIDFDPEINHEIADTLAEIIRQGMVPGYNPYEETPVVDMSRFDLQPVEMDKPLDLFARAHVKWGLERWEGVQGAFMAAERWSHRTDLTERERCHGVAHDVYHQTGTRVTLDRIGQDMPVDPGQDYVNFYENQFGTQIRNRTVKAAQDLFKD